MDDTLQLPRHGRGAPRGETPADGARFGRLFPQLPRRDPGAAAIEALARALVGIAGSSTDSTTIPAGYTYLAQFVDHDLTFDSTSRLARDNDPRALADFRTPRLDLDSLYGSGPADQPFLYDWRRAADPGVKLLVGENPSAAGFAAADLPRNQQGRALIGDARNDEHLIVAQLHLLFIRFHNAVVDSLPGALRGAERLAEARRVVRWHYQWIVMHDLLAMIAGDTLALAAATRPCLAWTGEPFMPIEFSAAAFRFGHSMVREDYVINDTSRGVPILVPRHPGGLYLGGYRRLPDTLVIDWGRFFGRAPRMVSMQLDASLSTALMKLPPDSAALPRLNLQRGRALGLPAGGDVADALGEPRLSDDQLLAPLAGAGLDGPTRAALLAATPLWYYVLCEAGAKGAGRLGPVGGRIVAEVLAGLLESDPESYRRAWPPWTPTLPGAAAGDFTMADLIAFTGKAA